MKPKLYLVDVSSMFFRAFYAIPPLTNSQGLPTNALYGFLSMTIKLIKEIRPECLVYCFDRKEPSFRHKMYDQYKANRSAMPEDLVPQVPYVRQLTEAMGIPALDCEGYEADDVIGSLVRFGLAHDFSVVIVSGDKDFAQLVGPFVSLYDTMKNVRLDEDGVFKKWGVRPEQMIDYLSLIGDSSDNIPGVRGIGPKGAVTLLTKYQSLDEVYNSLEEIKPPGLQKKLREGREMALLSRELVTIHSQLNLINDIAEVKIKPFARAELRSLLELFSFKTFIKTLTEPTESVAPAKKTSAPNAVDGLPSTLNSENVSELVAAGTPPGAVFSDVVSRKATLGQNNPRSRRTGEQLELFNCGNRTDDVMAADQFVASLPPYADLWVVDHQGEKFLCATAGFANVSEFKEDQLKNIDEKIVSWKGFNLKGQWHSIWHAVKRSADLSFDQRSGMQQNGETPKGFNNPVAGWDSAVAAYILTAKEFDDEASVMAEFLAPLAAPESLGEAFKNQVQLANQLSQGLTSAGLDKIYRELELPVVAVLYAMEKRGVFVDAKELGEQSLALKEDLHIIEEKIYELAGGPFNVLSPKQLGQILFGKLGLAKGKKIKTGFSTNIDALEKIRDQHAIIPLIVEFRELYKLKSTYVDTLPQLIQPESGRIHTHFSQTTTATGRLSSRQPNLQNIPIRSIRGNNIRKAFRARQGCLLVSSDYSQIELRILAHVTGDEGLLKAFNSDLDVHALTAAEIFEVPLESVSADFRRQAKAVNFGIAYGQGAFGLAETLGISRGQAQDIIKRYFQRFPRVQEYMVTVVAEAKANGWVESLLGRKRYLPELKSAVPMVVKFGERAAINAPIQGSASDIVKKAMIDLYRALPDFMLLQVHDELLFEIPETDVDFELPRIVRIMESTVSLRVPLKVNTAVASTWKDAHG